LNSNEFIPTGRRSPPIVTLYSLQSLLQITKDIELIEDHRPPNKPVADVIPESSFTICIMISFYIIIKYYAKICYYSSVPSVGHHHRELNKTTK